MSTPSHVPVDELLAQAGWVRGLAGRLVRDGQSADDLAQGTLVAALEKPPKGDRPLRPWLARVLANLARKERRGAARREERERWHAGESDGAAPGSDQLLAELEEQQLIARFASELREPYRSVLLLRYYRGQTSAEIAQAMGVPPATVRSQLSRGLDQLRQRVQDHHGGNPTEAQGAFLLAAGLSGVPRSPVALAPVATTTSASTLLLSKLALMNSNTQVLLALGACAVVVTGVLGWRALGSNDPVSPTAVVAAGDEEAELQAGDQVAAAAPGEQAAREAVSAEPQPEEGATKAAEEDTPAPVGPTTFVARAVDVQGSPVSGARLAIVDKFGVPRDLGEASTSGIDGVVRIEVPKAAFFTYVGREVSNVHMLLGAQGHAHHFFVPGARQGTDKDLGDISLKPGGSAAGLVIDESGAPVVGALVIGAVKDGDTESVRINGPAREGGRPSAYTDSSGRFELGGLPLGKGHVWAGTSGKLWTASDELDVGTGSTESGLTLVLEDLALDQAIHGLVLRPDGTPAPGAMVMYHRSWKEFKLKADSEGGFLIPSKPGSKIRLVAYDPSGEFGPCPETPASPGEQVLQLQLTAARSLRIRVVEQADGSPIQGASVIIMPLPEQSFFMHCKWTKSDADGYLDLVAPGEAFRVSAGHTTHEYRKFGPFEIDELPDELLVELTSKPMLHGVVLDGDQPVAGATIQLAESCEDLYRPVQRGFPQRISDNSIFKEVSDEDGRFAAPIDADASRNPVLMVSMEGYSLAEHELQLAQVQGGAKGIKVQLDRGGSLMGQVIIGKQRSPASVVVAISRGDGRPLFMRPDSDGFYRFDRLTPGQWRVEHREQEPEGRVMSMAQGEEHPFRWDCDVRVGEVTRYDLDLRWLDDLQVRGRVAFDGVGAGDWTAHLRPPSSADRPWPVVTVALEADGRFSLEARPGPAILELRGPAGGSMHVKIERELVVDQHLEEATFEFETGTLVGQLDEGHMELRLYKRLDPLTFYEAMGSVPADLRLELVQIPSGEIRFSRGERLPGNTFFPMGHVRWYKGRTLVIQAGEKNTVE